MNMKHIPVFDDKIRELIKAAGYEQASPGMNERILSRIELTAIIKPKLRYKPVISWLGWIAFLALVLGLLIFSYLLAANNEMEKFSMNFDTRQFIDKMMQVFAFPELSLNISGLLLIAVMGILIWGSVDFILNSIFEKQRRNNQGNQLQINTSSN